MSFTISEFKEALPQLVGDIQGKETLTIEDIRPVESATANSMVFVSAPKYLKSALDSQATAIVCPPQMLKAMPDNSGKTLISSPNPKLCMALAIQKFFSNDPRNEPRENTIHSTAIIHSTAQINPEAMIDAGAVIGAGVHIGAKTWIGANCVIEKNVRIGNECIIYPLVMISRDTQIGNYCEIKSNSTIGSEGFGFAPNEVGDPFRIPQRGNVVIEDHCHIGANCTIDRAAFDSTKVGHHTIIDDHIHIAHNCQIGHHSIFAGGAQLSGSVTLGNYNIIGGATQVAGHLTTCDHVQIAGKSGVTNDIKKPGAYGGYPLQPLKEFFKTAVSLKKLNQLRKDVSELKKNK